MTTISIDIPWVWLVLVAACIAFNCFTSAWLFFAEYREKQWRKRRYEQSDRSE